MKEHLFKNLAITFIITNLWTFFLFFSYLLEEAFMFRGVQTLALYFYSMVFGVVIGLITIVLRIISFKKDKSKKLKSSFLYLFSGVFNLVLFVFWVALISFGVLYLNMLQILYVIIFNGIISLILLYDLFLLKQ